MKWLPGRSGRSGRGGGTSSDTITDGMTGIGSSSIAMSSSLVPSKQQLQHQHIRSLTTSTSTSSKPSSTLLLAEQQQQEQQSSSSSSPRTTAASTTTATSSFLSKLLPRSFPESFLQRIIWVLVWGYKAAPVALYESFRKDYTADDDEGVEGPSSWWKKTIVVPTAVGFYFFMYHRIAQPLVYTLGCCSSDIVTFLAQSSVLVAHFISGLAMHLCEERQQRRRRQQQQQQHQDQHTAAEAAEFERRFHETTVGNSQYHLYDSKLGGRNNGRNTSISASGGRRFRWPRLFGGRRKTEEEEDKTIHDVVNIHGDKNNTAGSGIV